MLIVGSNHFVAVVLAGSMAVGGGIVPPRPAPSFPPSAPSVPGRVIPTPPPTPPTGGLYDGHDPLDRKLRVDQDRFRELADDERVDPAAAPRVVAGVLGERLALDLARKVAAAFTFDAVAGTRLEFVARIEGGRATANVRLVGPDGIVREDVVVKPGRVTRIDRAIATTTGTYRLELQPQPGDERGTLFVTTRGVPPDDLVKPVAFADGKPELVTIGGMPGRSLRSVVLRVPRGAGPLRPYVDVGSPSGESTRIAARVVDGDPTQVIVDGLELDELGDWTLRIADLSRETRAGELTLAFDEPKPNRHIIRFEGP